MQQPSKSQKCCWGCGKPPMRPMKCSKCLCAQYCGRECQKVHWPVHKLWCLMEVQRIVEGNAIKSTNKNGVCQSCGFNIFRAASLGDVRTLKSLLSSGTDPNQIEVDMHKTTALIIASSLGHAAACALLIEYGSLINMADQKGCTALTLATQNGHVEVTEALLAAGISNHLIAFLFISFQSTRLTFSLLP